MPEASEKPVDIGKPVLSFEYARGVLVVWGLYESDTQAATSGPSPRELTYTLTVEQTGEAGTSKTSQAGTFRPSSASSDTLASVSMRVSPDDRASAALKISHNDATLETAEGTWQGP
jgi:hypothetical protein